jgi:hypothetical protein
LNFNCLQRYPNSKKPLTFCFMPFCPLLLSVFLTLLTNPFVIPFEDKQNLTREDVSHIQSLLRKQDVNSTLEKLYMQKIGVFFELKPLGEFEGRINRCMQQVLIDPLRGQYPETNLVKINKGGKHCFVVSCPLGNKYPPLLQSLIEGLKEIGFDGHIYYRIGGVPNPTGQEAKWAGVPYAFKIFMMMEAHNLGFDKIIWLDSALFPFKDPLPLFERIEKEGSFLLHRSHPRSSILPSTLLSIETLTGVDLTESPHVRMWVFGLDAGAPWAKKFFRDYTEMVRLGFPFISCFPEEYVLSGLVKKYAKHFPALQDPTLVPKQGYGKVVKTHDGDSENFWRAKEEGYMFVVRGH